jgi:hypothetical protein
MVLPAVTHKPAQIAFDESAAMSDIKPHPMMVKSHPIWFCHQ